MTKKWQSQEMTPALDIQEGDTVQLVGEVSHHVPSEIMPARSRRESHEKNSLDYELKKIRSDLHMEEYQKIASGHWDDNRDVVRSYIRDLGQRGDAKAIQLLGKALKNGASYTQRLACSALAKMATPGLETLVEHLIQSDGRIRPDVYQTLHTFGEQGVSQILDILQGNNSFELSIAHRAALIQIVGDTKSEQVSAFLAGYLISFHAELQRSAANALKRQGKYAEKILLELLQNLPEGHRCQRTCIYLLGHLRSRKATQTILPLFCKERNPYRLSLAAWALGQIGAEEAVSAMLFVLEEEQHFWMVRRSIIRALGNIGSVFAVEPLIPYLQSRELRESVIEAFGKIGGELARETLQPYLRCSVRYLRFLTVTALSRMGDKEAIQAMLEGLVDEDPLVRHHTEQAFSKVYSPEELNEIYERLEEEIQQEQRLSAWEKLLGLKSEAAMNEADEDREEEDVMEDEWAEKSAREIPQRPGIFSPSESSRTATWEPYPEDFSESPAPPSKSPFDSLYSGKSRKRDLWSQLSPKKPGLIERFRKMAEEKLNELSERILSEQMPKDQQNQPPNPFGAYYDPKDNIYRR